MISQDDGNYKRESRDREIDDGYFLELELLAQLISLHKTDSIKNDDNALNAKNLAKNLQIVEVGDEWC